MSTTNQTIAQAAKAALLSKKPMESDLIEISSSDRIGDLFCLAGRAERAGTSIKDEALVTIAFPLFV